MGVTVISFLTVADFHGWKTNFDAHEHARVKAGIHVKAYKNFDDKNPSLSALPHQNEHLLQFLRQRKSTEFKRMLA